jgi:hypothetical protein
VRTSKNITFNEAEIATFMNVRNLFQETTTPTTSTKIIENAPDTNDINIILENVEDAPLKSITIEPAPIRRSIRHKKATFKAIEINAIKANAVGAAETPIISADEKESEKEDYLSKAIIAKSIITNEDKPTYEKAIADPEKF